MNFSISFLIGLTLGALIGALLFTLLDLGTRNLKRRILTSPRQPSGCWTVLLGGWVGAAAGSSAALTQRHGLQVAGPILLGSGLLLALFSAAIAWSGALPAKTKRERRTEFLETLLHLSFLAPLPWALALITLGLALVLPN